MSIFVCSQCGVLENTALCLFWVKRKNDDTYEALCSQCDPEIGQWHGIFERQVYDGTQHVDYKDGKWLTGKR